MNRFLVIGFELDASFHYALIVCKRQSSCTEYRFSVMDGAIEQQLGHNKTFREINGCLYFQPSNCRFANGIVTAIAAALAKMIGLPLKKAETWDEAV